MILDLPDINETRIARELVQKGREKGLEEGLEKGRGKGCAAMIDSILYVGVDHFGPAPEGIETQLARLSLEELTVAMRVLWDSSGWVALMEWITKTVK